MNSEGQLTLNEYQRGTTETAIYPGQQELTGLTYVALGLASEAGEFAGKVKKILRDGDEGNVKALSDELGDVLWYVARAASELGRSLGMIGHENLDKLQSRMERGSIKGSGDNR